MIEYNGNLTDTFLEEIAGIAARRLAVLHNRKRGMSWSVARKLSLSAMANDDIKEALKIKINGGMHPKDAIHEVVEERKPA